MLDEAKAMIRVSKHDHIVNFQGICVANDSVYLLLEYCTLGSIDAYLRKHVRDLNQKLRNQNFSGLMGWCIQIADGMEFLVKENDYEFTILIEHKSNSSFDASLIKSG